eukprot:TRINITY_DN2808_c0_g1_i2.p1 TRINITY_DN2808_c0_g1~~TRINITY_DN2808_c0_g1_i2.p1  ORF type:complete len:268 (+),score=19.43 TRINITY_DN2808_c0_g1_i2:869-1672(+)
MALGYIMGVVIYNLVLTLGIVYVLGGINSITERGKPRKDHITMLFLSILVLLVPGIIHISSERITGLGGNLSLSRTLSMFLIVLYVIYLVYMVYSVNKGDEHIPKSYSPVTKKVGIVVALIFCALSIAICVIITQLFSTCLSEISTKWALSQIFMGGVLLPLATRSSYLIVHIRNILKKETDIAYHGIIQTTIAHTCFGVPLMILCTWIINGSTGLGNNYGFFEVSVYLATLYLFDSFTAKDKNTWFDGVLLVFGYVVVVVAMFYHP